MAGQPIKFLVAQIYDHRAALILQKYQLQAGVMQCHHATQTYRTTYTSLFGSQAPHLDGIGQRR